MAIWSVVHYSHIPDDLRFEAEYFQPKYLELNNQLASLNCQSLESLASEIRSGPFGSNLLKTTYVKNGVLVLRPFNIKDATIEDDNLVYISNEEAAAKNLKLYNSGDLVFARVGDIRCGIIPDYEGQVTISPNIIAARIKEEAINPYFLALYMNTSPGLLQMERGMKVVAQPTITVDTIKNVLIPKIERIIQDKVANIFKMSLQELKQSKILYTEAENILLHELELSARTLAHQATYTAMFSEVMNTQRFDAEYFQPKYHKVLEQIKNTDQGVRLGDWLVEPIKRGVLPEYSEDGDTLVINSQHVGKTYVDLDDNRLTTWKFCQERNNKRAIVHQYDVLLNSTGYNTIGRCQTLLDRVQAIVDGHVSIIRPKKGLDPVYLGVYLNGIIGQLQTERGWTGSSGQIELRSEVITNYMIWKAPTHIQMNVRDLVEKSHKARQKSRDLLKEAEREIEAIIFR